MGHQLMVETVLLNSIVGADSTVYIKLGDGFVMKKAQDLNPGDRVLVHNEGIHKTLEEIEPVLDQSVRYKTAESFLLTPNSEGEKITTFRQLLLQGLAPNDPDLEAKVMKEGMDFSQEDYASFRVEVVPRVDVVSRTVSEWLHGDTIAPHNWANFIELIPVNKEFETIVESVGEPFGFHAAYQLYVGLRKTIMNYLTKRTGKKGNGESSDGLDNGEDREPGTPGKYRNEIELVVGHFMEEIDDEKSVARVTKVKRMKKAERQEHERRHPDPHLRKGVITTPEEDTILPMKDVLYYNYFLENAMYDMTERIADTLCEEAELKGAKKIGMSSLLSQALFSHFIENTKKEEIVFGLNFQEYMHTFGVREEILVRRIEGATSGLVEALRGGDLDRMMHAEPHTSSRMIDLLNQYRQALPKAYTDKSVVHVKLDINRILIQNAARSEEKRKLEKDIRKLESEYNKLEEYVRKTYELDAPADERVFFMRAYESFTSHNRIERGELPPDNVLRAQKQALEQRGIKFLTRREVHDSLKKIGIPDAINFYRPQNFLSSTDLF
jgi:hypothetical protein